MLFVGLSAAFNATNACAKCFLRMKMWDKEGRLGYIEYSDFRLEDNTDCYRLRLGMK